MDITPDTAPDNVESVITNEVEKSAMALACQVSWYVYTNNQIDYLENDNVEADICFDREITFNQVLKKYVEDKKDLYIKKEDPNEKNTRSSEFTINDAKAACNIYIDDLWKAIKSRVEFTDLSDTCAFTEAPAEGIFSIYSSVIEGKERLTVSNAVALTRVSLHGPPPATEESARLSEAAMRNYGSQHGERYCTTLWRPGMTSNVVKKVMAKKWDF